MATRKYTSCEAETVLNPLMADQPVVDGQTKLWHPAPAVDPATRIASLHELGLDTNASFQPARQTIAPSPIFRPRPASTASRPAPFDEPMLLAQSTNQETTPNAPDRFCRICHRIASAAIVLMLLAAGLCAYIQLQSSQAQPTANEQLMKDWAE